MTDKLPYSTECEKPPPYSEDIISSQNVVQTEVYCNHFYRLTILQEIPDKSIYTLDQKKKEGDPELGGGTVDEKAVDKFSSSVGQEDCRRKTR